MQCSVVLALLATIFFGAAAHPCIAKVDATYELNNISLAWLNPHLSKDPEFTALKELGCPDERPESQICFDKPGVGSGLAQLAPGKFIALTDQGPNQACENGKQFPLRQFTPSILHMNIWEGRQLRKRKAVPLRSSDGRTVISGLPNTEDDDVPYSAGCTGETLSRDPSGLDPEDIGLIPGTDFAVIVEEYSPSIVVANYWTGSIKSRHVPSSKSAKLADAKYPIVGDIPDVYTNRRKNRGFEGVVVAGDGSYAIAIVQSPMLGEDSTKTSENAIIRCAYFDIKREGRIPELRYSHSFVLEASPMSSYVDSRNKPKDIMYSAAQDYGPGKFFALERAKGQVKLFLVDFSKATNIDETTYSDNLNLEASTNGARSPREFGVVPAEKTLIWDSALNVAAGTSNWEGSNKQEGFAVDMEDNSKVWMIEDNDFGAERKGPTSLRKISLGRKVGGATVCDTPVHPPMPNIDLTPSKKIRLVNSMTYRISNEPGAGAAENFDVDEYSRVALVANDQTGLVDSYNVSVSPVSPIRSSVVVEGFKPTSVSVCPEFGRVAIAYANDNDTLPGLVHITNKMFEVQESIVNEGCFLPDSVKWSKDCSYLVAACEGEGAEVPGGVLVIDYNNKGKTLRSHRFASFEAYDSIPEELRVNGVRLIESDKASLDLQPEFVGIVNATAYVTVQEANAIAVVDLAEAKIGELKPIGFIDRSRKGFALDSSDRDGGIHIRNYDFLYGMPQPDTISAYVAKNNGTYLVFANEGDALESEEARGADITNPAELGRIAVAGLKELVEDKGLLGRLKFTTVDGYNSETNTQEKMFHYGSRSFSIMDLNGNIVFDSGEWFGRIMEMHFPAIFNANGFDDEDLSKSQADLMDNRSDDKGGEPESLSLMTTGDGSTYAFIGLERPSIIVVFEISDPYNPTFVDAVQNNPVNTSIGELFQNGMQGDLDPEGLFASLKLRKLFVSGSVSNTLSSYDIVGL